MEKEKTRRKLRSVLRWVGWVLLLQFLLINISAALYADKFTRLHIPHEQSGKPQSTNIFAKTWRLFSGPVSYRLPETEKPAFPYETVLLETKTTLQIAAWYSRVDSASRGTVILFHGLMGNKSTVLQQAYEFRYWGYNVMLVDARGHGNSGGNKTTIGYRESEEVKLAYEYVKKQGDARIYLWGLSMGAVQVLKAVAQEDLHPAGIILEMPFGSLQSHVKGRIRSLGFPRQPFGSLITFWMGIERGFNGLGFNMVNYAKKINCPVLLQCGARDQLVSKEEIEEIYAAIPSLIKKLVVYTDANHEAFLQKDPARWRKEAEGFLKENR